MAGKHIVDIRLNRPPSRNTNQQLPQQSSKGSNRPISQRPPNNRGGIQARNREGRPRDLEKSSDFGEDEEEEDYSQLILDAYQDDRKGVRRLVCMYVSVLTVLQARRQEKSLNHLLNFHYSERAKAEHNPPPARKVFNKPFRKEAFVQAKYVFCCATLLTLQLPLHCEQPGQNDYSTGGCESTGGVGAH